MISGSENFESNKEEIMPKRKTYLIASLLDECDTNDMKTINCNTVKPMEIINKECEPLRLFLQFFFCCY